MNVDADESLVVVKKSQQDFGDLLEIGFQFAIVFFNKMIGKAFDILLTVSQRRQ